jgi:ABC-2 type transport system ATP-binding protein
MHIDIFETVWAVTTYSRGLFGLPPNDAYVEKVLKDLSLWDKKDEKLMALSGGMKRRVLIAKALVHEPEILFLDEPTAGVDVELRRDMWGLVRKLRDNGCTIILTTHYIEEAEEMADRVGVISKGELVVVEEKKALMKKLGKKSVSFHLNEPLNEMPGGLDEWQLSLKDKGHLLEYTFDTQAERTGVTSLIRKLSDLGITFRDLDTKSSSLEDIFVSLVHAKDEAPAKATQKAG